MRFHDKCKMLEWCNTKQCVFSKETKGGIGGGGNLVLWWLWKLLIGTFQESRVDKGDKYVSYPTCGLQSLMEVCESTWEDQRPSNSSLCELAAISKEMNATTFVVLVNSIECHIKSVRGSVMMESKWRLFSWFITHNKVHSSPWLKGMQSDKLY